MLEGLENVLERIGSIQQRVQHISDLQKKMHGSFDTKLQEASKSTIQPMLDAEDDAFQMDDAALPRLNESQFSTAAAVAGRSYSPGAFDAIIQRSAEQFQLPPALIKAVMKQESNFNPRAVSPAGASGLMQLMPQTAQILKVNSIFDPEQNVRGGAQYLRDMLNRYQGDLTKALAAYNAGPGNVDKYGGVPDFPETQNYVRKVLQYYSEFS